MVKVKRTMKEDIEDMRSCISCANLVDIVKDRWGDEVNCRHFKKPHRFMKFCPHYIPRTCANCKHRKSLDYRGKITRNRGNYPQYYYFDVWDLECEKEGVFSSMKVKSSHKKRDVRRPSCSLWSYRYD